MTNWSSGLDGLWAPAVVLVIEATVVLAAGIGVQHVVRRSAVFRYTVLFWSLTAVALSPAVLVFARSAALSPLVAMGSPVHIDFGRALLPATAAQAERAPAAVPHIPPITDVLLIAWAIGCLSAGVRLAVGWRNVRSLTAAAATLDSGE